MAAYEFQFKDDGILLNTDVATEFVDITNIAGFDMAPVRVQSRDRSGQDGAYIDAELEEARTIVINGTVYGGELYLDDLKGNYAPTRSVKPFYYTDDSGRRRVAFCKSYGMRYDISQLRRLGMTDFQITLVAPDPALYSEDEHAPALNLPVPEAGFTGRGYDRSYPYGYGGFAGSPLTDIINAGNRPMWPTFEIYGNCTNPKITNETTGEFLRFMMDIGNASYLEVDSNYKQVLLNGSSNRRGNMTPESTWFPLQPGHNVLRYSASDVSDSQCIIRYRDAWR